MSTAARRQFLVSGAGFAAGAVSALCLPRLWPAASLSHAAEPKADGAEARLQELGLKLPTTTAPLATYVPTVLVGDVLYVSGHVPRKEDGQLWTGKVGQDCDLDTARQAARQVGLQILASVKAELGSLDRVVRLVKTLGMVNATPDFTQQPQVINGFSDLLVEVFGAEAGKGTRSAVGVGSLPGGVPLEVECVFQVQASALVRGEAEKR